MDIVNVENICKSYDGFKLSNVTFDIPKGHVVGIVGENGSGKTTTIKSILNIINIDSGNVKIFGLDSKKSEKTIKENIGVVLDDSFIPGYYTIVDIDKMMSIIHKNWDSKLFDYYITKFKLPKNKEIKHFSKGMYIKTKIAAAISYNPKLLILDEPTSGLDPIARSDMLDMFRDYMKDNEHAIFISSHITTDLEKLADDIIFIDDGKIILNKTREELLNDYLLVTCTHEQFDTIDSNDYINYKRNRFDCELLVDKNIDYKEKYNINNIVKPNLEKIMIIYIRGDK